MTLNELYKYSKQFYLPKAEIVSISLGANVGNTVYKLRETVKKLRLLESTKLFAVSRIYRSVPVGPVAQPCYVNSVVLIKTRLAPYKLLFELKKIEQCGGRKRHENRWGPRILDLDIITFGDLVMAGDGLRIPHTDAHCRRFVLLPLCEVAPNLRIPKQKETRKLLKDSGNQRVYCVGKLRPLKGR